MSRDDLELRHEMMTASGRSHGPTFGHRIYAESHQSNDRCDQCGRFIKSRMFSTNYGGNYCSAKCAAESCRYYEDAPTERMRR